MTDSASAPDYRDTVFLPVTDFPMKAGLAQKEPAILARWQADDLEGQIRAARAGRPQFILHDGPPYANGDIHIGHALNHILKDMVVRTRTLMGQDSPYVPGWDCHGLPIEWKVEEAFRKAKRDKDAIPPEEFRAECRAYAAGWVDRQREQLKRLGIGGAWDRPYLTMDYAAEATIVAELLRFAATGQLYRGAKPVMWSPVEKTALAEAEVEYEDVTSTQIDVAFEIIDSPVPELIGAHALIWTTTPWTIPVNQAIAYGPEVDYVLVAADERRLLVAEPLLTAVMARTGLPADATVLWKGPGSALAGTTARHPLASAFAPKNGASTSSAQADVGTNLQNSARPEPVEGPSSPLPQGPGATSSSPLPHAGAGQDAATTNPASPLAEFFTRPRPFLPGDFVTTDQGTGLVHMAPDHGEDDFALCQVHGIGPMFAVEGDGRYRADWAWLGGHPLSVIKPALNAPDGPICTDLRAAGALLSAAPFDHSYPHSWRSKARLIYRCTPQWFIPMDRPMGGTGSHQDGPSTGSGQAETQDKVETGSNANDPARPEPVEGPSFTPTDPAPTLRATALGAIADTRWVPAKGENRIRSMVEGRPDWVISRQRAWGVPITLFVDRRTGDYLRDPAVDQRIVDAIAASGVDAWCDANAAAFLGPDRDPADYERVTDILDVWFDSGSTHAFVLRSGRWPELTRRDGQAQPADLYLEGSDQHRGWFQSSLLQSCGTRGAAPYKAVLTHGFTMDQSGRKMSKSLGNTVDPIKLMEEYGADILRLWALSVDFTEDHRIGKEILAGVADQYRKWRNTFRYLLGALQGFSDIERVAPDAMPELERYMLGLLGQLDARLRAAVEAYDFNDYVRALGDFINNDLSAFYFDIRKDSLYCDIGPAAPDGLPTRRAYRSVLDTLFHALIRYAAPVIVFTAEEAWGTRYPDAGSVHLLEWPEVPADDDPELAARYAAIRAARAAVTEAIEPLRRAKTIRSSLEAMVTTPDTGGLPPQAFAEIAIVADVAAGDALAVTPTTHAKCGRCWRHLPDVPSDGGLCGRCDAVLTGA